MSDLGPARNVWSSKSRCATGSTVSYLRGRRVYLSKIVLAAEAVSPSGSLAESNWLWRFSLDVGSGGSAGVGAGPTSMIVVPVAAAWSPSTTFDSLIGGV